MSTQTKVPDFNMIDEYNEKFEKTTTEQERLEVIKVEDPPSREAGMILESVGDLVDKLKNEAKVI